MENIRKQIVEQKLSYVQKLQQLWWSAIGITKLFLAATESVQPGIQSKIRGGYSTSPNDWFNGCILLSDTGYY